MLRTNNEQTYTQLLFRDLLDCMARPGTIKKIRESHNQFTDLTSEIVTSYAFSIGLTFIDQEVSFHIFGDDGRGNRQLKLTTLSESAAIEECDYLFTNGNSLVDLFSLKRGSPFFPDENATVICQVDLISSVPISSATKLLTLTGPGIQTSNLVYIEGLQSRLLEERQVINQEFPVGIDWIIVDKEGKVCCIPRSTMVEWSDE